VLEQVASTLMRVIRMNDRLAVLTEKVDRQQQRIEDVSARLIRLETALELGLAQASGAKGRRPRLPKPGQ
jgi:hypothetical protein